MVHKGNVHYKSRKEQRKKARQDKKKRKAKYHSKKREQEPVKKKQRVDFDLDQLEKELEMDSKNTSATAAPQIMDKKVVPARHTSGKLSDMPREQRLAILQRQYEEEEAELKMLEAQCGWKGNEIADEFVSDNMHDLLIVCDDYHEDANWVDELSIDSDDEEMMEMKRKYLDELQKERKLKDTEIQETKK
ncbi:hypothetical protein PCE1_002533 [Barthelona sp. PCE]